MGSHGSYILFVFLVDEVVSDLRRIVADDSFSPSSPGEICGRLLTTIYMGTSNSSEHTRSLAESLAHQIGRYPLTSRPVHTCTYLVFSYLHHK